LTFGGGSGKGFFKDYEIPEYLVKEMGKEKGPTIRTRAFAYSSRGRLRSRGKEEKRGSNACNPQIIYRQ